MSKSDLGLGLLALWSAAGSGALLALALGLWRDAAGARSSAAGLVLLAAMGPFAVYALTPPGGLGLVVAVAASAVAVGFTLLELLPSAISRRAREEAEAAGREVDQHVRVEGELRRQVSLVELLRKVTVAANEASSLEPAVRTCLASVCELTGWPIGHAYLPTQGPSQELASSGLWLLEEPERFRTFRKVTEATKFAPGQGLPGRVLQSGRPIWIPDIARDSTFLRARWAKDIGVRSGFAFPILVGSQAVGVLEFFSPEPTEPDGALLDVMADLGTQVGRVVERQWARAELAAARDAALEASRLKSAFLANMSHEIRTPLNVILGYNTIIAERFPDEGRERTLLEGIERASNRLLETIHGILDLSKIETKTFRVEPVAVDLVAVVRRHAEDLAVLARKKGLEVRCEIEETDAGILFDEYCLSSSFLNLLQNAIKFTEKGWVSLRLYRGPDFGLRVEVRDTGIGIDADYIPRLFSPFSQEEAGYTRRFEGSGLGLALTKNYLELNEARLEVESAKGEGSTFTICFSKGRELWETQASPAPVPVEPPEASPPPPGDSRPVVLVVEDDADTLAYMKTLLREHYEVVEASSGRDARRRLDQHGPNIRLVLMDLSLRGDEDGLDLTAYLRSQSEWKDLPVIAVTAHAFPEDRVRALEAGCDHYLSKPFERTELLGAMSSLIRPGGESAARPSWVA